MSLNVSLYQLTREYEELMEMLINEEADPQVLADTLETNEAERKEKLDGCAKVWLNLKGFAEMRKKEEERLAAQRKTIENNIKRLENYMQMSMEVTGDEKIKTGLFSFTIQNNPPAVVIDNMDAIPKKFFIKQEPKLDKTAIKELLKQGKKLKYAHLVQGRSLRIR